MLINPLAPWKISAVIICCWLLCVTALPSLELEPEQRSIFRSLEEDPASKVVFTDRQISSLVGYHNYVRYTDLGDRPAAANMRVLTHDWLGIYH